MRLRHMFKNRRNRLTENPQRGPVERIGTVAARRVHAELHVHIPFFIGANGADIRPRCAIIRRIHDISGTFIKDKLQFHPALFQQRCRCPHAGGAGFLVLAEKQIRGPPELPSGCQQIFRTFQNSRQHLLDIHCPASPDHPIRQIAGKRTMRPVLLCSRDNRDDILMCHEKRRPQRRVCTRDPDQQAVTDAFHFSASEYAGIRLPQKRLHPVKFLIPDPACIHIAGGLKAKHLTQMFNRPFSV